MSAEVSIKINAQQFLATVRGAVNDGLFASGLVLQDAIVRGFGSNHGGAPSSPGSFPNSQTGIARASFATVKGEGFALVGSDVPYLRYLNNGASISPKKGKALGIPLTPQAKTLVRRSGGSIREAINAMKGLGVVTFRRSNSGVVVILDTGGKVKRGLARGAKSGEAWFLLTSKTIHIAPRPWARLGIARARGAMMRRFVSVVRSKLGGIT